jgi:hypothetical protein
MTDVKPGAGGEHLVPVGLINDAAGVLDCEGYDQLSADLLACLASPPVAAAGSDGEGGPPAIWLEPTCCAETHGDGRRWSEDPCWEECDGHPEQQPTKYVRADLAARAQPPAGKGVTKLRAMLIDVRDNGLIYWEPNTDHGHVTQALMLKRIEDVLAAHPAEPAAPDGGERERAIDVLKRIDREYGVNHTSKWCRDQALAALRPAEGGFSSFPKTEIPGGGSSEGVSDCSCYHCSKERFATLPSEAFFSLANPDMRMVTCAICGNKRCPHATDHRLACTNSNEPGQPGSNYGPPLPAASEQAVAGEWITWPGGENPVGAALVEVEYRNGERESRSANRFGWTHWGGGSSETGRYDIIAYRVVTAADTPSTGTERSEVDQNQ